MYRSLFLSLTLALALPAWGQSTVVCTTSSPGTVIGSCASGASDPLSLANIAGTTSVCSVGPPGTANSVCLGSGVVSGEGSTAADGFQTNLTFLDATADNALNLLGTASSVDMTATTGSLRVGLGTGTGRGTLGGVLCKGVGIATTGTSEQALATCTIPANTLSADGATLRIHYFFHSAANGNNKQIRIRVGGIAGTLVHDTGAAAMNNRDAASYGPVIVTRLSATTATAQGAYYYLNDASVAGAGGSNYYVVRAAAITWANANDLVITGTTPTASGDLTLDTYTVEVVQ